MEHIFMPDDQTNQNYSAHPNKCCNKMRTRFIVATINPILRRPCVHPSTFHKVLIYKFCSSKHRESSSLHTIILEKQTQTKHLIALIIICVYFSFH